VLHPKAALSILLALVFQEIRQLGYQGQVLHADGPRTIVPVHKGIGRFPILLSQMAKDIGLSFITRFITRAGLVVSLLVRG
jgi:predicted RNA binding protein YcfA (HicA-like mRNA interferase family)